MKNTCIFKRKGNSSASRPFNENNYTSEKNKRPKTHHRHTGEKCTNTNMRRSTNNNLFYSITRSMTSDRISEVDSVHHSLDWDLASNRHKDANVNAYSTWDKSKRYNDHNIDVNRSKTQGKYDFSKRNELFNSLQNKIK